MSSNTGHQSVLLHEALENLDVRSSDTVVDATLGGAGHALELSRKLDEKGKLIGFDMDEDALDRAREKLRGVRPAVTLVQANFRHLTEELQTRGIASIDRALFDLGWSSYQLDAGRGFSFQKDEPLLMTYAKHPADDAITAASIVNVWQEESIADVLWGWGGERYGRRIAQRIVERRKIRAFTSAHELAEFIKEIVPAAYRNGKIHPATKTFQALRIAVNDEIAALKQGIEGAWERLTPGGRIAVITFHSIEDREVKNLFRDCSKTGAGRLITKKPIVPSDEERAQNPRARSAKLRVIEKI